MSANSTSDFLPLGQLMALTGLTADQLLGLLERGQLRFACGEEGELLVDVRDVAQRNNLLPSTKFGFTEADSRLVEEIVATELLTALEPIADEAISIALRWLSQRKE